MGMTPQEWMSDVPEFLALGMSIKDAVDLLPPSPNAVDVAKFLGSTEDGAQLAAARLIDRILTVKDSLPEKPGMADYGRLLGASEDGPEMKALKLADVIRAQAKD